SEHRGEVLANLADVLGRRGDHLGAGRRYLEAAPLLEGKEQRDAYYDAVVRLQRSLEKADEQSHVERVVARAGLRRAGSELLKHPLPEERARRVRFAIART